MIAAEYRKVIILIGIDHYVLSIKYEIMRLYSLVKSRTTFIIEVNVCAGPLINQYCYQILIVSLVPTDNMTYQSNN